MRRTVRHLEQPGAGLLADLGTLAGGELRTVQLPPVGERGGDGHATVDADGLARAWLVDRVGDDSEGDVPLTVAVGDAERLRRGEPGALAFDAEAEADPSTSRHLHLRPPPVEFVHGDGAAHDLLVGLGVDARSAVRLVLGYAVVADDAEALVHELLAPGRFTEPGRETRGFGLGEVLDRLYLDGLVPGAQPCAGSAGLGELTALLGERRGPGALAVGAMVRLVPAPMRVLLDREIPHVPRVRAVQQHLLLLPARRVHPKPCHAANLDRTFPHRAHHRSPSPMVSDHARTATGHQPQNPPTRRHHLSAAGLSIMDDDAESP
ncbi:hypothetical protein GCM10010313_45220 [Streptomyces violarus]|uniref:Uncharacterized protein n=1 Tax=Streptomyces violarus TaxID=67380 RepID=A0A7W5F285_9ACTN|nr:hypothetical protein [Streptomyces violarus]GHD16681.1 hypothetical protein GCM10010313_45220 [Streptomyces violarus]